MSKYNDMTIGNIKKNMLLFALPLIVSNILQNLYNAVDMYFAGQFLGTNALAAVSVSGPIINLLLGIIMGMSIGVTIMISTYVGYHDETKLKKGISTAITVYAVAAVIITLIGYFGAPLMLKWNNTPIEAYNDALDYMRIIFLGVVFTLGYNLIGALHRGLGDSKSSMFFVVVATIINVVLDYVLLKYTDLEVKGTAIATIIAQAVSFAMGMFVFIKNGHGRGVLNHLGINKEAVVLLFKTGLPGILHQLCVTFSSVLVSGMVNTGGVEASAAYGIGLKIYSFATLPSSAVCDAESCVVSQNLGAGRIERAQEAIKHGMVISMFFNVTIAAAVFALAPFLAGFMDSDVLVIEKSVTFIRIMAFQSLGEIVVHPFLGFFRGTSNSAIVLGNSLITQYVFRQPVTMLFTYVLGMPLEGAAVAALAATGGTASFYWLYYRTGRWRKHLPIIE